MKLVYFALLSFIISVYTKSVQIEAFEIKLDASPAHRYDGPNRRFFEKALEFINLIIYYAPDFLKAEIKDIYYGVIKQKYPEHFAENQAIAAYFGLPEHYMFLYQFMYETYAYCTSIVAAAPDGTVIHGRNFDYPLQEYFIATHYIAVFTLGGKEVFRSPVTAGYNGVFTGLKPGKFAVSLNHRQEDHDPSALRKNIDAVKQGRILDAWALRKAMTDCKTFDEAVEYLSTVPLIAPAYFIISGAGPNEGVVITRSRNTTIDKWTLTPSTKEWFLVQVNTDHWDPIPPDELDRRTPAIKHMNEMGRENNTPLKMLSSVMKPYPNNNERTIYCSVMCPKDGTLILEMKDNQDEISFTK